MLIQSSSLANIMPIDLKDRAELTGYQAEAGFPSRAPALMSSYF